MRQVEQLFERLFVMAQPGGHVDVADDERSLAKCFGTPCHRFGHHHGIPTASAVVVHVDDRFGGTMEHDFHLVAICDLARHVRRQEHAHREVNVLERIDHGRAICYILHESSAALSVTVVDDIEAVRTSPIVATISTQIETRLAEAIVDGNRRWRGLQSPINYLSRRVDAVSVCDADAGLRHSIERFLVVEPGAHTLQNFQTGVVNLLALLCRQTRTAQSFGQLQILTLVLHRCLLLDLADIGVSWMLLAHAG